MSVKNAGLGRGLGALLGDDSVRSGESAATVLRMAEVEPNTDQPRRYFDETALAELADSIRQNGVLQPLLVRRLSTGYYQIIAGERRWRAARLAGLTDIPAIVLEADNRRAAELALIENLQREDLNPLEEADGFRMLIEEYGLTQEEAGQRVGRSRPAIANSLRLLSLPDKVSDMVREGTLSAGHARTLLGLPSGDLMLQAAALIVSQGLSVRQTEVLCKKMADPPAPESPAKKEPNYLVDYERGLSAQFGRKVSIVSNAKRGKITIEFYGAQDLDDLLALLQK